MVDNSDEQGKKKDEEKTDAFTPEGEAVGYISLDQARVLAMRTARDEPGAYGRRFRQIPMAFEVVGEDTTEDHYVVTLSFRPEGEFEGTPGQEQFVIEKEGAVALRQVLSLPRPEGRRRIPILRIAAGLAVLGAVAVVAVLFAVGALGGGDDKTAAAPTPTEEAESPIAVAETASPTPAAPATFSPTATPVPTATETRSPPTSTRGPGSPTPTLTPLPPTGALATPAATPAPTAAATPVPAESARGPASPTSTLTPIRPTATRTPGPAPAITAEALSTYTQ